MYNTPQKGVVLLMRSLSIIITCLKENISLLKIGNRATLGPLYMYDRYTVLGPIYMYVYTVLVQRKELTPSWVCKMECYYYYCITM